jgi:hypothetical protein
MTSSARIPAASASRYAITQRPPTPTPDVSARKDLQDAGRLRDREAIVTQNDDVLASRKRKREGDASLTTDPDSVVHEKKSKQSRHALSLRREAPAPGVAAGEGEAPDSPTPEVSVRTPEAPTTSSGVDLSTPERPTRPALTSTALRTAPTLESDGDLSEHTDLLHGELVSIYAGEDASADTGSHTLLYEHAVYTENNETLALSTDPNHGVYADCVGNGIVWAFSSQQAVGLLAIRHEHIDQLDTHLPQGLAEFMTAHGSSQGIRIQLGYSPRGYREELTEKIREAGVESTRARLGLVATMTEASVIEAAVTQDAGRWRDRLSALASTWGAEPAIIEIPHEAIHISRDGIDLFESEPYAQLPKDLDVLFD